MANFAVLDGENVLNIIVADSKTIAEEITGKTCIEFTTEPAQPGGTYSNNAFIPRKPYESWILSLENIWEAPSPHPDSGKYIWDENTISWIEYE